MPTVTADDKTRIAFTVDGSGPPLLLLHGITETSRRWDPLIPSLARDFTCVRLDMRGHGDSSLGVSGYDIFTMAGDVGSVVAAVGLEEPPVVIGHSMGGILATVYASGTPGDVRGVINIDQMLRLDEFAALVRPLEAELRGPGFGELLAGIMDALGSAQLGPTLAAEIAEAARNADPSVVLGMWAPLFELSDAELSALVNDAVLTEGSLDVPYLALHGVDPGADYAAWLTERVPTATVETWDGSGHWPHLVEADRFATRVRQRVASG